MRYIPFHLQASYGKVRLPNIGRSVALETFQVQSPGIQRLRRPDLLRSDGLCPWSCFRYGDGNIAIGIQLQSTAFVLLSRAKLREPKRSLVVLAETESTTIPKDNVQRVEDFLLSNVLVESIL